MTCYANDADIPPEMRGKTKPCTGGPDCSLRRSGNGLPDWNKPVVPSNIQGLAGGGLVNETMGDLFTWPFRNTYNSVVDTVDKYAGWIPGVNFKDAYVN